MLFVTRVPGAAGIVAVIEATPLLTDALTLLKVTPVNVPVFFVNPHPLTVVSVGIDVVSGKAPTSDAV